jgi:hypothetical protein
MMSRKEALLYSLIQIPLYIACPALYALSVRVRHGPEPLGMTDVYLLLVGIIFSLMSLGLFLAVRRKLKKL